MGLRAYARPNAPVILAQSATAQSVTGTTTETTLATITIPGGMMGANGKLRVSALFSMTNNANNKTPRIRLGGSETLAAPFASASAISLARTIANRGATNSQLSEPGTSTGFGTAGSAVVTTAVDTSVDQSLTITGQLAVGTDTLTLEGYTVEVLPA